MISINGVVFSGNSVVITNGRSFNGGGTIKSRKFDEKRDEDANNVESIIVNSTFVDVNISASNSSKIESHFYGQADVEGDVDFDVCRVNNELRITLNFTGSCYNGNLRLDVNVPHKFFKMIYANIQSADIGLNENVLTEGLIVKTKSGNLETSATFKNASITTKSGDVELFINAGKDIGVEITTMSGDVSAVLKNIRQLNLSTATRSGDVRNCHNRTTGYTADVNISTMSGDISIY